MGDRDRFYFQNKNIRNVKKENNKMKRQSIMILNQKKINFVSGDGYGWW